MLLACDEATCYRDIKDKTILPLARSLLTPAQQYLVDKHAPERMDLPSGRRAKITYAAEAQPYLSARIQDLYGVTDDLHIASGRHALLIHVLGPNHRPLQVTTSLRTFWSTTYPELRPQLARQYPKHEWR